MKRNAVCFLFCRENNHFLVSNSEFSEKKYVHIFKIEPNKKELFREIIQKEVSSKYLINIENILSLDWGTVRKKNDEEHMEMYYLVFVKNEKTALKIPDLAWIEFHQFIESIEIDEEKELVEKVLLLGINNEKYFNKRERGE